MSQPLDSDLLDELDEPEGRSMPHALDEGDHAHADETGRQQVCG